MANVTGLENRQKNIQNLIADLLLAGVLVYLYFFASTQYSLFDTRILILSGIVMTGLAAVWLMKGRQYIPRQALLPLAAFTAAQALAAVMSIDPRRSVIEVWLLVTELSLFLFFIGFSSRMFTPQRVVRAVLLVGGLLMALSWSEAAQWYLRWVQAHPGQWLPAEDYRLPAPNFLCTILNVWLMFALPRLWWSKSSLARAALGLYILSALGLIYLTSSRGGWFGTVAGLGCLWLVSIRLAPDFWKTRWQKLRSSKTLTAAAAAGGLLLVGGFAALILLQDLRPGHSPFLLARGYLWQPAWNAFLRSPVWGSGPFTFISFYAQVNSVPPFLFFDYAHNIYLDLLGGSGLLGLASFIWLAWAVMQNFVHRLREKSGPDLAVLTGALAACGAFLVHGLFDSVHHTVPTSAWNLAVLLGAASAAAANRVERPARWQMIAIFSMGVLSAAGFFINAWLGAPMAHGVQAAQNRQWNTAAAQFELAVQRDPSLAATHQQLGLAYAQLYLQGDTDALQKAELAFQQAAALDPYWLYNHANLGLVREAMGDLPGALQAYQQAVKAAPLAYESQWLLGRALEKSGDSQTARSSYLAALKTCPQCACKTAWQATPLTRELALGTDCTNVPAGAVWNPGYLAYMFRRPAVNVDLALTGE